MLDEAAGALVVQLWLGRKPADPDWKSEKVSELGLPKQAPDRALLDSPYGIP